jgi:hypothetical protein
MALEDKLIQKIIQIELENYGSAAKLVLPDTDAATGSADPKPGQQKAVRFFWTASPPEKLARHRLRANSKAGACEFGV